jgi:hypothetical protein
MSAPEGKTSAPAGISSPEEVDVTELFERVRAEVRRSTRFGAAVGDAGAAWAAARTAADRFAAVTAERPLVRRPGLKGTLTHPVKVVLRRLMRWYVEPLAAEQRAFNAAVLELVDDLGERVARLEQQDPA